MPRNLVSARMVGDKVAIKLDEPERQSKGGIALPESAVAKTDMSEGVVVAVGPGRVEMSNGMAVTVPVRLTVGERVIIDKYGRHKVKIDGEEIVVVTEADVLAVLGMNGEAKKK